MAVKETRFSGKRKRGRRPDPKNVVRKQLNDEIRKANKRLIRMNKHGYQGKWAAKTLFNRLDVVEGITTKGRTRLKLIKPGRELSIGDIKEIQKAIKFFKESKVSTIKGIKRAEERTKATIRDRLTEYDLETGLPIKEPSKKDVEAFYNLFENKDYQRLIEYIPPSDLDKLLNKAKEMNKSPKDFIYDAQFILDIEDEDIKGALMRVYKLYLKNSK